MRRRAGDYDERDVRVRPSRRGSRPRTKDRPAHEDAVIARVVRVDRGRFTCLLDNVEVAAMKARELRRGSVVVGDQVALVGDTSGESGTLARIVRTEPRSTVLRRTADDTDPVERVIVANVDTMVIVTAIADPEPRPRLIDRCLVAAYDAGITPLLMVTKTDLADPAPFVENFAPLGVEVVTSGHATEGEALDPEAIRVIRERLTGCASVLVGHSGVGKSTLVNALVPGLGRATGHVNESTGRGRHTSTSAVAAGLPDDDGWIVDTPGIRSFGLAHVEPDRIVDLFGDLVPGIADCPRGCTHDEPECGLDSYVESAPDGASRNALRARLDSLRRLLRARRGEAESGYADGAGSPPGPV